MVQAGQKKAGGFTLVELLVTLGVIGLLAGLLLPALSGARAGSQVVSCLSRERQITLGWHLYAEDVGDLLPYNVTASEIRQAVAQNSFVNWSSTVLSWELESDNTNKLQVTQGGIGPYVGGAAGLYRCPADRVLSEVQAKAGWEARVRSFSMNAMMGDPGGSNCRGTNRNNPDYLQFFKLSQVVRPDQYFVFIEEHPDSINDGSFLNHPDSLRWSDLPASYHAGAANLTFADGHAQRHYWRFSSTKPPARPNAAQLPFDVPLQERADFRWLMQHTSVETDPSESH